MGERLREMGMDPMLCDSNGAGGYHVWVLLDKEYPLAEVYDFANNLRSDWKELGLEGFAAPLKVTCADHSSHNKAHPRTYPIGCTHPRSMAYPTPHLS